MYEQGRKISKPPPLHFSLPGSITIEDAVLALSVTIGCTIAYVPERLV